MITNRELIAQDWHRLNGLLATALELEPHARVAAPVAASSRMHRPAAPPASRMTPSARAATHTAPMPPSAMSRVSCHGPIRSPGCSRRMPAMASAASATTGCSVWLVPSKRVDPASARSALENSPVFPEEELRERFVRRVTPGHVAWLAFSGDTEAAELLASRDESAANTFYVYWLRIGQSFAQRQNGRYTAAIATARKLEEACPQIRNIHPYACISDARALRAAAQLDAGELTAGLASANQALERQDEFTLDPQGADLGIVVGRARLANGRVKEALEPLRQAYGFWLGRDPNGVRAAEAEYWFGQAYLATGDKRGHGMVAEAQRTLARSPLKSHRALAVRTQAKS